MNERLLGRLDGVGEHVLVYRTLGTLPDDAPKKSESWKRPETSTKVSA